MCVHDESSHIRKYVCFGRQHMMKSVALWQVVAQLLMLSHGQASVERGFSVNKQMERANMCHETFVAERVVNEHVTSAGGVLGVTITKELLTSCRASRTRYANHCDEVRRAKLSEAGSKKRKCIVDKIDDLRAKRQHLTNDITELQHCADEFAVKAERSRDFTIIAKSNALRASAKEKSTELSSVVSEYDTCVAALKDV